MKKPRSLLARMTFPAALAGLVLSALAMANDTGGPAVLVLFIVSAFFTIFTLE